MLYLSSFCQQTKKIAILILYTYVFDIDRLISYELFLLQTNIIISAFKNPLLVDLYSLLIRSAQRSIFTVIVQGNEPELCVTYWWKDMRLRTPVNTRGRRRSIMLLSLFGPRPVLLGCRLYLEEASCASSNWWHFVDYRYETLHDCVGECILWLESNADQL